MFPFPCGADSVLLHVGLWKIGPGEHRAQRHLLLSLCGYVIFL